MTSPDNLPEAPGQAQVPQVGSVPESVETPVVRRGMFGTSDSGDTSGYGGLVVRRAPQIATPRPYGGYFDELVDALGLDDAVERVVVDRGELTLHVKRERLVEVCQKLRDDPALSFELSLGVSGVHYPHLVGEELHSVIHLCSVTHNTRVRIETSAPDADPHIPSTVGVYPGHDWHERETYDFFGIVYDGHPGLTRIMMPDDWDGHPQRKDYPLGGIPVEYRGATIPAPDQRRSYA